MTKIIGCQYTLGKAYIVGINWNWLWDNSNAINKIYSWKYKETYCEIYSNQVVFPLYLKPSTIIYIHHYIVYLQNSYITKLPNN